MYPTVQKILEVMSNQNVTFFIPPYQRNYEWSDEQCKVFLEDIYKTAEANRIGQKTEHFFGSVTYFMDHPVFGQPSKLVLIDGQQRITTTMLFLIALRDIIDDENQKEFINDNYIKNNKSVDSTEYKIKLKQVETDWEVYKHIVLSEAVTASEKAAAVYKNYQFFKSRLTNKKKEGENLLDLISFGLNNFSVVTLQLQPDQNPWENPQEIFESMNSIGKPLSLADLVRNYLLLGLDPKTQENYYHNYWLKIEKRLPNGVSSFIRDYMQCVEGAYFKQATEANCKELYSNFKNCFIGLESEDLLKDLATYSEVYAYIVKGISTGVPAIDREISDMKVFSISTAFSFILKILMLWKEEKITAGDTIEMLDALRIYTIRRRLVTEGLSENKNFPLFINKIDDVVNAKDKRMAMFKLLSSSENSMRLPNDLEMARELEVMNFYNSKNCKFLLAMVEEGLTKSRPDLSDKNLQVEHIMPQTLSDDWKMSLGVEYERIHAEYVNTIGNLTLIRHNQELSNNPFPDKKNVYENKAGLQIARKHITDCTVWNEETIKDRTHWIVDYILKHIIPIPEDMRRTSNFVAKEGRHLSFLELQLIGEEIEFIAEPKYKAKVVSDAEVEFEGKKSRLSPLTRELYTRMGTVNKSGSYQGAQHWAFEGIKLSDLM